MQEHNISINNFEQCIKCAICTDFCPVMEVLPIYPGPKHGGPDGERLRLKNSLFFDENLKFCMNCKRCEVACPSGVKIADLIQSAREKYGKHVPSLRDFVMANTDLTGKMAVPVSPLVNAITGLDVTRKIMDKTLNIDHRRVFPTYSGEKFVKLFKKDLAAAQAGYKRQVVYFHGCYTNYNKPELGINLVRIMNALGYGVELMDKEKCCGVAMIGNGMFDKARSNARNNSKIIRVAVNSGRTVITTSSTCTLTIRDEYPGILGIDNSDFREDVVMALKFIYEKLSSGEAHIAFKKNHKARTAYHTPCHMEKLGWSIFTRELMNMIPGMEMKVLDSNCCGIAGTYGYKKENYDRSQAIGQKLFEQIYEVDPEYVICECETCKWQIEMSTTYRVKNPITVLAEAMDFEETARLNA